MNPIYSLLVIPFLCFTKSSAQNYSYVHGNNPKDFESEVIKLIDFCAVVYGIENATFHIREYELTPKVKATIEHQETRLSGRKMFIIRIRKLYGNKDIKEVLAHKMVHAYQFYIKDLVKCDDTNFIWKGASYREILRIEHSKRPWEMEAIKQSKMLIELYATNQCILTLQPTPYLKKVK